MMRSLPIATEILPAEEGEAEGCVQCQKGSKLVLFVTGKCHWGCDYCPLSENRRETPDMFANERRCTSWEEVIEEGRAMQATGTGITGGDPIGHRPRVDDRGFIIDTRGLEETKARQIPPALIMIRGGQTTACVMV